MAGTGRQGDETPGGNSHIQRNGVLVGKKVKGTKILFCVGGLKFFSLLRGTNSKTIHYYYTFFFPNTLKGAAKAPAVHLLRLKTLRDPKTGFLTPKSPTPHRGRNMKQQAQL